VAYVAAAVRGVLGMME
jgi:membrane protein DedA with SNARE-associated domain